MRARIMVCVAAAVGMATTALAQEPPAWVPLPSLEYGGNVRDVIELSPWTFAAGGAAPAKDGSGCVIWGSQNDGVSWELLLWGYSGPTNKLVFDSVSGRLWAAPSGGWSPLLYTDVADPHSWNEIPYPGGPGEVTFYANATEILGDYIYVGGYSDYPFAAAIYRLSLSNLSWERLTYYFDYNNIAQLKAHDGRLLVFAKKKDDGLIRLFAYNSQQLDQRSERVGKATVTRVKHRDVPSGGTSGQLAPSRRSPERRRP